MFDLHAPADLLERFLSRSADAWTLGEIEDPPLPADVLKKLSVCQALDKEASELVELCLRKRNVSTRALRKN